MLVESPIFWFNSTKIWSKSHKIGQVEITHNLVEHTQILVEVIHIELSGLSFGCVYLGDDEGVKIQAYCADVIARLEFQCNQDFHHILILI